MLVIFTLAVMLEKQGKHEDISAHMVYKSEAITAMAEAVVEEIIHNIREQLNIAGNDNQIYYQVRQRTTNDIPIDSAYLKRISPNSHKMLLEEFSIEDQDVVIKGKITDIAAFDVKGFTQEDVRDEIEKSASFEIAISIKWADQYKTVAITRPFKVVRTTMPVFSESTLFVNNAQPIYFGQWPSLYGYDPGKFPAPQNTIQLDHGWHKYSKYNKKSDFTRIMETDTLRQAMVPPGRVFIQKGIVPITNGDRASGMLQKTFHSHESELLPAQAQIKLKDLKTFLTQKGMTVSADPDPSADPVGDTSGTSSTAGDTPAPTVAPGAEAGAATEGESNLPDDGELFVRYVGHGEEVKAETSKLGDKDVDGYGKYFYSFLTGWEEHSAGPDPAISGLDLYGRIVEKEAGEGFSGGGIFGKIAGLIKKATSAILSKLWKKYDIRISPTLVYGQVIQTYFPIVDYVATGWTEKMKNTFSFNPNQVPLPHFDPSFLEKLPQDEPISEAEKLPDTWPADLKEKWLKLPEDIRKPKFYKIINTTILQQNPFGLDFQEFGPLLPQGALFAPAWEALLNYLVPEEDSPIRQYLNNVGSKDEFFLSNEADRKYGFTGGPYAKIFSEPLTDFNPFLFYVKATDYISAIYDPRNPKDSIFLKKYYNKEDEIFEFKGVIYITGTEPLVLGNAKYRGKAIIITFGKVIFSGPFRKEKEDDPEKPEDVSALTIITLGGVVFDTSNRIDAQIYSYIFPPLSAPGKRFYVYGGLGANMFDLTRVEDGGIVVFDWAYHIPLTMDDKARAPYYHVAITDEINKYGYEIRRDLSVFQSEEPP